MPIALPSGGTAATSFSDISGLSSPDSAGLLTIQPHGPDDLDLSLLKNFAKSNLPTVLDGDFQQTFATDITTQFENWYKIFPYQIVVRQFKDNQLSEFIYTLPIPPESLSVQLIPASEATATLGGVVEETSATTFWNLQLAGTTGIAVGRPADPAFLSSDSDRTAAAEQNNITYRDKLSTSGLLGALTNGLSNLANGFDQLDISLDNFSASPPDPGAALAGLASQAFTTSLPYSSSGVLKADNSGVGEEITNGHLEIMRLHRFLYQYSLLKADQPTVYSLYLKNWKDNNQWQIVVKNFSIQKNAANPYLYRYQISLKGWNISEPNGTGISAIDRFAKGGDLSNISTMTVTGAITGAKNIIKNFNSAVSNPGQAVAHSLFPSPVL